MCQMMLLVVALLMCLATADMGQACPFYIIVDSNTMLNFSTMGPALISAMESSLPLWVCDQSVVGINDTLPVINQSVTVIGNRPRGEPYSYLTIENPRLENIFVINVTDGPMPVVFENINIVSTNTLFVVNGTSQLILSNVRCYFSIVCVELNPTPPVSKTRPTLLVIGMRFEGNAVGILHRNGYFGCEDSVFYDILDVGILTFNSETNNPYTTFMTLYNNVYVNVLYPLAYENLALARPYFEPPRLSEPYVDATAYTSCQTYIPLSSKGAPTSFGVSSNCITNCSAIPCENNTSWTSVLTHLLDTLAFVFFVIIFYTLVTMCIRLSRSKNTNAQKNSGAKT